MLRTEAHPAEAAELINDPNGLASKALASLAGARRGKFVLCLGATRSSDKPGVSAAGLNPARCRHTPALDAEILLKGAIRQSESVPFSPDGVISPVVITRACLDVLDWDICVVNCGTFISPQVPIITAGTLVANCISSGEALPSSEVERLYEAGRALGRELSKEADCLIVAECVPGGTSTAYALLYLLGFEPEHLVSASAQKPNEILRRQLLDQALSKLGEHGKKLKTEPLGAVAAVGDPMQPFAAGFMLSASQNTSVIMGGGSQMLAVSALGQALAVLSGEVSPIKATVMTTKWVAHDPCADTRGLSELVGAPLVAARLDFSHSLHEGLRQYEHGFVKEGVGAGASIVAALLSGKVSPKELVDRIDRTARAVRS